MTRDEVRFLLARLGAAYGRRPVGPDVAAEWERALRRYPAGDAHQALNRLIDEGEPGPSLPGFVAHVRALQPPRSAPSADRLPDPDASTGPPYAGPTESGRRLARIARERLWAAPEWQPVRDRREPGVVE